jgi:excisionase family DNA binding protein
MLDTPITLNRVRESSAATLTRTEVAQVMQVDPRTVTEGIRQGIIPAIKLGRRILIPREKFLALFDAPREEAI